MTLRPGAGGSSSPPRVARPLDPPVIVVTDRRQAAAAGHRLVEAVAAAVDGGARTVLLREKDLPRMERARLAEAALEVLAPAGGLLLVAGDVELAQAVGAAGVHLSAPTATPGATRPGAASLLVGRSCHSVEELRTAEAEGLGYATLSPIWLTDSKPGYGPALGLDGLASATAAVRRFPVYALGGVGPGRVAACIGAGAAGVAVMGAVMRADDPATVVRTVLEELDELEALP